MTTMTELTLEKRDKDAPQGVQECPQEVERLRNKMSDYQQRTGLLVKNGFQVPFATPTAEGAHDIHTWLITSFFD